MRLQSDERRIGGSFRFFTRNNLLCSQVGSIGNTTVAFGSMHLLTMCKLRHLKHGPLAVRLTIPFFVADHYLSLRSSHIQRHSCY